MINMWMWFIFCILLLLEFITCTKQTFRSYTTCSLSFGDEVISFPNITWTTTIENSFLSYSLCTKPSSCKDSATCFIDSGGRFLNLGTKFVEDLDDYGTPVFRSIGGAACTLSQNYTVIVSPTCSSDTTTSPHVKKNDDNECEFLVTMMKPDCKSIPCTFNENGHFIDLRPLRRMNRIFDQQGDRKYAVSVCGPAPLCRNRTVNACVISSNTTTPIASTQRVDYDYNENELSIKGYHRFGVHKNDRYNLEVILKCNWSTEFSNLHYIPSSGKNYKFLVDSSYGCVKMPMNCKVQDWDNYWYDLSSLYRHNGHWNISYDDRQQLLINMCGPLSIPTPSQNTCNRTEAQVCLISGNTYESRGSLFRPLKIEDEYPQITFTDGAVCKKNTSLTMETHVTFHCANEERGPVLTKTANCSSTVKWETPAACPFYEVMAPECCINDMFGKRNLSVTYTTDDNVHYLSKHSSFRYNLCGPLKDKCAGFNNVSACITYYNKDYVIGWENSKLMSRNGNLTLSLTGSACPDNAQGEVLVNFLCDYDAPGQGHREIKVRKDNCVFTITVHTPLACISTDAVDCTIKDRNVFYNLSGLSLPNRNYEVRDSTDPALVFSINVCRPVVMSQAGLRRMNTGICRTNTTDANMKTRYASLGDIASPKIMDGHLVVHSEGNLCDRGRMYSSIIHFECSEVNGKPKLHKKSMCQYEFKWYTPHACPKQTHERRSLEDCILENKGRKKINLTNVGSKILKVNNLNKSDYIFDICTNQYQKCSHDECLNIQTKRELIISNNKTFIEMPLQEICKSQRNYTTKIFLECSNEEFYKNNITISNCTLSLTVQSKIGCTSEMEARHISLPLQNITIDDVPSKVESITYEVNKSTFLSTCLKKNPVLHNFNLSNIKPFQVISHVKTGSSSYFVNFYNKSVNKCDGFICKEELTVASTSSTCLLEEDKYKSILTIKFVQNEICDHEPYYSEVHLVCDKTGDNVAPYVTEETLCGVSIDYPSKEACDLLSGLSTGNTIMIISAVIIVFLILITGMTYSIKKNKCCPTKYEEIRSKSAVEVSYLRARQKHCLSSCDIKTQFSSRCG